MISAVLVHLRRIHNCPIGTGERNYTAQFLNSTNRRRSEYLSKLARLRKLTRRKRTRKLNRKSPIDNRMTIFRHQIRRLLESEEVLYDNRRASLGKRQISPHTTVISRK